MKYSMFGFGVCGLVTCWVVYFEMNHEHHHYPDRAYKKVRAEEREGGGHHFSHLASIAQEMRHHFSR